MCDNMSTEKLISNSLIKHLLVLTGMLSACLAAERGWSAEKDGPNPLLNLPKCETRKEGGACCLIEAPSSLASAGRPLTKSLSNTIAHLVVVDYVSISIFESISIH